MASRLISRRTAKSAPSATFRPFLRDDVRLKEMKEQAERLEEDGDLNGAWGILSEEWMNHTDIDYFDDEMAA